MVPTVRSLMIWLCHRAYTVKCNHYVPATLAELNDKDFCFFVTLSALDVLHTLMLDILDDTNGLLITAFTVLVAE